MIGSKDFPCLMPLLNLNIILAVIKVPALHFCLLSKLGFNFILPKKLDFFIFDLPDPNGIPR